MRLCKISVVNERPLERNSDKVGGRAAKPATKRWSGDLMAWVAAGSTSVAGSRMRGCGRPPAREASLAKGAFHSQDDKTAPLACQFDPKGPIKYHAWVNLGAEGSHLARARWAPGEPVLLSCVCIIRDVPAWQQPSKVSGVLTCRWALLLPFLVACFASAFPAAPKRWPARIALPCNIKNGSGSHSRDGSLG